MTTFDGDGMRFGSGFQHGQLNAVHVSRNPEGSGHLILAGNDSNSAIRVMAIDPADGSTVWGTTIWINPNVYSWQDANDVIEQVADQKVVVAGVACRPGSPYGNDFALARLNDDGTLDTTFGGGGTVTANFGLLTSSCQIATYDTAYTLMESADDQQRSIYAVGKTGDRFAVMSFLESNGLRDPNFHGAGMPDGLATGPAAIAYDAKVQYDSGDLANFGKIVAVGARREARPPISSSPGSRPSRATGEPDPAAPSIPPSARAASSPPISRRARATTAGTTSPTVCTSSAGTTRTTPSTSWSAGSAARPLRPAGTSPSPNTSNATGSS